MPYQFEVYDNRNLGTILDLMMAPARARAAAARASGEARARAAEIRGQHSAQLGRDLGQIAMGVGQQIGQIVTDGPRREMEQLQLQNARDEKTARDTELKISAALRQLFSGEQQPTPEAIMTVAGPERGLKIIQGLAALRADSTKQFDTTQKTLAAVLAGMDAVPEDLRAELYPTVRQNLLGRGIIQPEDAPEKYDPAWWKTARSYGQELQKPQVVAPGGTLVGPNGQPIYKAPDRPVSLAPGARLVQPGDGSVVAEGAPKPRSFQAKDVLHNGRPVTANFDTESGKYFDPTTGQELQGVRPVPPVAQTNPSRIWVIRNGRPMRITEAEYQPGDLPANTREQGRPVISGDANKIADFDTSLDDLQVLDTVLSAPESTGVEAKVRASLPNWANELTSGWGNEAKSRQAVIDRVKQVIGKALEGGVLRKEDEYKYEKILPTIGDARPVVQSKLKDLHSAIERRRATLIDALDDAGYDVTQYRQRDAQRAAAREIPAAVRDALKDAGDGRHTLSDGSIWIKQGGVVRRGS
jgi:hypothetical protein